MQYPIHPFLVPYIERIEFYNSEFSTTYPVYPSTYLVMGVQIDGYIQLRTESSTQSLSPCGITGLQSTRQLFSNEANTQSLLVYFKPAGAWIILGIPLNELAENSFALAELNQRWHELSTRLLSANNPDLAQSLLQEWLIKQVLQSKNTIHPNIKASLQLIHSTHGIINIENLSNHLGISKRQLERLFKTQVGVSPKEFSSLTRFNYALENMSKQSNYTEFALKLGYSDQAHFIRQFKYRTHLTPGVYLQIL